MEIMLKLIFETPSKGAQTRVSCINALPSAIRICNEEYTNRRGMCITQGYPIPCKMEFIFNEKENQIQEVKPLIFEGDKLIQIRNERDHENH